MDTSTSPLQGLARETAAALVQLRQHDRVVIGSSRELVDTAQRRLEHWEADRNASVALRGARAAAATAASEAAQAARFDARLLSCPVQEFVAAGNALERCVHVLRGHHADAAAHLEVTVQHLLDGFAAGPQPGDGVGAAARAARAQVRLAEDLGRALRVYGDRIEQLLLDLAEQVHATFGVSMGSALPTRVRRDAVPPSLQDLDPDDPLIVSSRGVDRGWRSVRRCQRQLDACVEDAIWALRWQLVRAAQPPRHPLTDVGERVSELISEAQQLDGLAEQLDWMLPADAETPGIASQFREHRQRRGLCRRT